MGAAVATAVSGYLVAHLGGFLPSQTHAPTPPAVAVAPSERPVPKSVPANALASQPAPPPQATQSAAAPASPDADHRTGQPQQDTTGSAAQPVRKTAKAPPAQPQPRKPGKPETATAATEANRPRETTEAKPRETAKPSRARPLRLNRARPRTRNWSKPGSGRRWPMSTPTARRQLTCRRAVVTIRALPHSRGPPKPRRIPLQPFRRVRSICRQPRSDQETRSADLGAPAQQPTVQPAAIQSSATQTTAPTPAAPLQVAPVQPTPSSSPMR